MGAFTSYLLSQLGYQSPALLVYLAAFLLAPVYLRNAPTPCILTMVGAGILLVTTTGIALLQAWLIGSRPQAFGRGFDELMKTSALAASGLRAVGLGLLVAAIFAGRRQDIGNRAEPGEEQIWR